MTTREIRQALHFYDFDGEKKKSLHRTILVYLIDEDLKRLEHPWAVVR